MGSSEPSSLTLAFTRHGESEANVLRVLSNRGRQHGLTERGRGQAAELAETLRGRAIARLYTSPLRRATETAEIVARTIGTPVEVADALREYDCGMLEGRSDAASWARQERLEADWQQGHWDARIEQGESFLDMRRRFVPFVERLIREQELVGHAMVLIGHGGLYRCMLPLVLTNIDAAFARVQRIDNTGCVVAELTPAGLICTTWCGVVVPARPAIGD
jgi:broad specificity phosphatase PhoE